jgi:hypothetical protein
MGAIRARIEELRDAVNEQVRATRNATETAEKQAEATRNVVISTSSDKQLIAEVHTHDNQSSATQTSIKWATWVAAWGAWAAFIAASVYAGIAASQLRQMRTATKAATDAVTEARLSRQQSIQAFNATVDQFRLDQRAWLVPGFTGTHIDNSGYVRQDARINNNGKTPATNYHAEFMIVPVSPNNIPRFDFPPWEYSANGPLIFPNTNFPFSFGVTQGSPGNPTHAEPMQIDKPRFDKGELLLLVYGRITYDDVFGRHHFVHICSPQRTQYIVVYFSTPASRACAAYSQIDQE